MFRVKNFFDRPDIENIDAVLIRNVKYLRSFSVQEFKNLYNINTVRVIETENHFIAFTYLKCIGYVAERKLPTDPVISLMTDALGNLFYLLHDKTFHKDELIFFKTSYHNKSQRSTPMTGGNQDWVDYQEYIRESYEDAFEGDSDAYWNID